MLKSSNIQNEYAFIAVFSLFMAMSFALGYVYSKNENTRMDKIAGEFLDAFLALSVSIVMARHLFEKPEEFVEKLPYIIILFGLIFFVFMYSIYRAEGQKPKWSARINLSSRDWEYLAMGIGIIVLCVVWILNR